ncbi:MAG: pyruvate, phosphate dikinase [Gemmatimonadetes bacterium]|nr:pyruvate, phosphate dikinase [Gemmatimonadota bacterium]
MPRYVYFFANGSADGDKDMKDLLGGKGANLAEMTRVGLPVPPGFTVTTEACRIHLREGRIPEGLPAEVNEALARLESIRDRRFGDRKRPLLVSVRSGAAASMPGMMDTVLNLGLNDETVAGLAEDAGDARFAYDCYRRFVQMYARVVLRLPGDDFEARLQAKKRARGVNQDTELDAESLQELAGEFRALVRERTGREFPSNPEEQLWGAIEAVFGSWMNERAIHYRRVHRVPADAGTAVNVQTMVFGNLGHDSGSGVAFTRNPSTGEKRLFGEFLPNCQGEDVVAGIRDPLAIEAMREWSPQAYTELVTTCDRLEQHYRDLQDIEFTVERGRLYMLQTRAGKRTAEAAVKIAVDLVGEGLLTERDAVLRVSPEDLELFLHPRIDPTAQVDVLLKGLPASPGAAAGIVVLDPDEAVAQGEAGHSVVLVRQETSPDDFHGMVVAQAILTARGGMTSHAAVVARGMGKPCVVGAKELDADAEGRGFLVRGQLIEKGSWITVDGSSGRVLRGKVATVQPQLTAEIRGLMGWADRFRRLGVRTNADTPEDARRARELGAEGIGLVRTEHMFFEGDRIDAMREMIVARDSAGRRRALAKIEPMQHADFEGIFAAMDGFPVTIRLLDPPLHEFLPHAGPEIEDLAVKMGMSKQQLTALVERVREANPMLGHRGCRLGITYPEITEIQARAIFKAAVAVQRRGVVVEPEIMIPLVADVEELRRQRAIIDRIAGEVFAEAGLRVEYSVGTMIELPRACVTAQAIAEEAEFFSFGTNDLTQTVFGISRDDAGSFLPFYVERGIYKADPFQTLDEEGVGRLIEMGVSEGRRARPKLKVGICGEHGGDPRSVAFCHRAGLDYVSCSPYRVPVARLAAAHAALAEVGERYQAVAV